MPASATTAFSGAFFDSQGNDWVGQGASYTFTTVQYLGIRTGYPMFNVSNGSDSFQVWFAAAEGQPLVPGTYEEAQRLSFRAAGHPGFDVFGDGRGCNTVAARFIVDDATYDSSGNVLTFSARFESHCEGSTTSALFGVLSYNSTAPYRARTVSANALQFISVAGSPITRSVTITNDGPSTDTPSGFAISGTNPSEFSIADNTCTAALAAGASCTVSIVYRPVSSSETAYANLSFTDELAPLGSANETASAGRGRFVTLTGIAGSGVTTGSITGTVKDPDGAGLGEVCVFFVDPASGVVAGPEAITASDGTYAIDNLAPGTYFVYFFYGCDGPYTENYAPQIYDGAEILEYATPVVVVRGPTYNVDAQLTAGAEITGHVADTNGQPLANVEVDAFPAWDVPEIGTGTFTNSNGDYKLFGLATGDYAIAFTSCPSASTCQTQWYDGARSGVDATLVRATAGQPATSGVNATFTATTPPTGGGSGGGGGGSGGGGSTGGGGGGTPPSQLVMQRISGSDAIGTSVAVSTAAYPSSGSAGAVVLARSDRFSDALAGGPLAANVDGPLLITPGASIAPDIDPRVLTEIKRVLPVGVTVYILGGTQALSGQIDTTLRNSGYTVRLVAGADEYATAVAIANELGNPSTVFEATGLKFGDALSAVPAAIQAHGAILLTDGNQQAPATAAYLNAHPSDIRYAIGGPAAAAGADPGATAIFGSDLYATSAAVATRFFPAATTFGAATGTKFADALGGGVYEGMSEHAGPMLLVPTSGLLPSSTVAYLQSQATTLAHGVVFGGPVAVSDDVVSALAAAG